MTLVSRFVRGTLVLATAVVVVLFSLVWSAIDLAGSGRSLANHALAVVETPSHRETLAVVAEEQLSAASSPLGQVALSLVRPELVHIISSIVASPAFENSLRSATGVVYEAVRRERPVTLNTATYLPRLEAALPAELHGITLPALPNWQLTFTPKGPVKIAHFVLTHEPLLLLPLALLSLLLLVLLWVRGRHRSGLRMVGSVLVGSGLVVVVGGDVVSSIAVGTSSNPFGHLALQWTAQMVGSAIALPGYFLAATGVVLHLLVFLAGRRHQKARSAPSHLGST
jgi:hypothetical protein